MFADTVVRARVNQPSTLQPFHKYNRMLVYRHKNSVIAKDGNVWTRVFFITGSVISTDMRVDALDEGWPINLRKD